MMRLGAKLPNSGPLPSELGIATMAQRLENAGFQSMWVSDHVVMSAEISSRYPYAEDGVATWNVEDPWYDAVVALAMAAAVTSEVEMGTAVLVLPQRQPVILAKQIASIDRLAGGRFVLGIGAGWMEEEFDALATPFGTRGRRTDEWIDLLRGCWTGHPDEVHGEHYDLPADVVCQPTPARPVPILVGGTTKAALSRAARRGDGWLGIQSAKALDPAAPAVANATADGRRAVLRIVESTDRHDEVISALPAFAEAGITDVIIDVDWSGDVDAQAERLRRAAES